MSITHVAPDSYKQQIKAFDEQLEINFSTSPIEELLENKSSFIDGILTKLWLDYGIKNDKVSINAVGGYGRKTLHPFSDIDICILHEATLNKVEQSRLESFITHLWDLGLNLGQAVRTLEENEQACRSDITIMTTLSDIRTIAGNPNHAEEILDLFYCNRLWSNEKFYQAKLDEQSQRHLKLANESFKLEPNLKKSPGGMRDIQTLIWVSKKMLGSSENRALRKSRYFIADEYAELVEAQNFIWRVRWALHRVAKRDENRLLLEYQADVAGLMGFGESGNLAIEKMMRQLFRAMKRIRELNQLIMLIIQQDFNPQSKMKTLPINNNFEVVDGLIAARSEDCFVYRKEMLAMFRHIAQSKHEIKGIAPETLRSLRQARRRLLGDLQDFEECRKEFISLFNGGENLSLAITLMHHYSILTAYLPQWREIVGQMQFDLFHAYTVDEHTYRVLINLISFYDQTDDNNIKPVAKVINEIQDSRGLLFSALFHDIAKGRGGDHSELGAIDAQQFCEFHQIDSDETELVVWLVKNHLLMSITSQRMDIHDPEVIHNFAQLVKTKQRLDALYCLTAADIKATNDKLWTGWKASLLGKLYTSTKQELSEGKNNVFAIRDKVRERKSKALKSIKRANPKISSESVKSLWRRFPLAFFSNLRAEDLAQFCLYLLQQGNEERLIKIDDDTAGGCSTVFVYMKDRISVFADLFGTLAALNITVKDAQISQTKDGYILESLKVLDYNDQPLTSEQRKQEVIKKLKRSLFEQAGKPGLRASRRLESFENNPQVEYPEYKKLNRTLISITALDNPNFMDKICRCFRLLGLHIHSAKISTVGESVDNVFLVSNKEHSQMSQQEKAELETLLVSSIKK